MRRSLALLLAVLMLCGATITGQTQIQGVFMLGERAVGDSFVTLAESTTFGPSGTIFDYSTRVYQPKLLQRPDTTGWTEVTEFRDDTCSSDDTTWDAIWASFTSGSDASDERIVYLPDNCNVRASYRPSEGSSAEYGVGANIDFRMLRCHPSAGANCGVTFYPYSASIGPDLEWDWTAGDVERGPLSRYFISVGTNTTAAPSTCVWTGGFGIGNKLIQLDGCDLSVWGVGDAIVLDASNDSASSGGNWDWRTRVTCVDLAGSAQANATGTDCTGLTGDTAQIKIRDGLPQSFADGAYFWGTRTSETVGIIESVGSGRGGVGTETDSVAEGIWFQDIKWDHDWALLSDGGQFVRWQDGMDGGVLDSEFLACGLSCLTIGGNSNHSGAGILIAGNTFTDPIFKNNCFSEITAVGTDNPVTITVLDGCTNGDPFVEFSDDVAESTLAGNVFLKSSNTNNGDGTISFTLTGVDGSGFNTTPGGIAAQQDSYGMALLYCNDNASNVQFIDNALIGTRMGPIFQGGCAGFVAAFNYIKNGLQVHGSRGIFSHGNGAAPGALLEGNDFDLSINPYATSNPATGEGSNVTMFKNRGQDYGDIEWPIGTEARTGVECGRTGQLAFCSQTDQSGTSNEDWNIFLNAFTDIGNDTSKIDCSDNSPPNGASACTADEAPYLLHSLAFYRNRATASGANIDDNFDLFGFDATPNSTTSTDVTGSNTAGTNYESQDVPSSWDAEVGLEPTTLLDITEEPDFWCPAACAFGQIGAYYDDYSGTLCKLPAQVRYDGGTCPKP